MGPGTRMQERPQSSTREVQGAPGSPRQAVPGEKARGWAAGGALRKLPMSKCPLSIRLRAQQMLYPP